MLGSRHAILALLLTAGSLAGCSHQDDSTNESHNVALSPLSRRNMTLDCAPAPDGLIHWWPAEGNAYDVQGNTHGALMNGATFAEGRVGQAFSLDGIDDYIDLGNDSSLHFSCSQFTLVVWIRLSSFGKNCDGYSDDCVRGILAKTLRADGRGPNEDGWYLAKTIENGISFCLGGGLGKNGCAPFLPTTVTSTKVLKAGIWYQIAAVIGMDSFAVYVNGHKEESKPLPRFMDTHVTNMKIGAYAPEYDYGEEGAHFPGLIDEVQVYVRALRDGEIQALYNARSAGTCNIVIDVMPGSEPNLVIGHKPEDIIPVAILSTSTANGERLNFDAKTVDPVTVRLGRNAAQEIHDAGHREDIDHDADLDLLLHFRFGDIGIKPGDDSINLAAQSTAGRPLRGCDAIRTPERERKLAELAVGTKSQSL